MITWWIVLNSNGEPVTSSSSKIECKKQIHWFLPKPSSQYTIEEILIPEDIFK